VLLCAGLGPVKHHDHEFSFLSPAIPSALPVRFPPDGSVRCDGAGQAGIATKIHQIASPSGAL
jgi:hypothetical protein